MKKIFLSILIVFCMASTGWSLTYTDYTLGPFTSLGADTILGYAYFSPATEANRLTFANDVLSDLGYGSTFLVGGTGMTYTPADTPKSIVYDPGFDWDYAVVKVDGPNDYFYLFEDTGIGVGGDNILQTFLAEVSPYNMNNLGISGITWFGGSDTPPPPVPEPATFILLGGGLVGLAFYRRRQK